MRNVISLGYNLEYVAKIDISIPSRRMMIIISENSPGRLQPEVKWRQIENCHEAIISRFCNSGSHVW